MATAPLTEANLKRVGGPSQAEQEEMLLVKMQALSDMLEKVNGTLMEMPPTTVPSSAGSSRRPPPTGERPASSTSQPPPSRQHVPPSRDRLPTGQLMLSQAPSDADANRPSHEPQLISLAELKEADAPVTLVSYTGNQSHLAGLSSRRKVDARATRSEMSSLLSWGGDDETGYYLRRQ